MFDRLFEEIINYNRQTVTRIDEEVSAIILKSFEDERRVLRKKYPAMSSDKRSIIAAKSIARKHKIQYQDLLKTLIPTRNIEGEKYWNEKGEIVESKVKKILLDKEK